MMPSDEPKWSWDDVADHDIPPAPIVRKPRGRKRLADRRFDDAPKGTGHTMKLRPDHPALREARTLFPSTVRKPAPEDRVLKSGHNNPKIGKVIQQGRWVAFPVYMLSLEERATCPRTCHYWSGCPTPDTPVLMADLRWLPAGNLKAGDRIVGFDEHHPGDGLHRKTQISVVDAVRRSVAPVVRVRTERGDITVTPDHRFLAQTSAKRIHHHWMRADQLKPDNRIVFLAEPWAQDTSYNAGRLRGFLEGEGCLSCFGSNGYCKTQLSWAQRPSQLLNEINQIVKDMGFTYADRPAVSGVRKTEMRNVELRGGWRDTLRFLGAIRPSRIMNKAEDAIAGHSIGGQYAKVIDTSHVGAQEIVEIATSTRTLIANGFMSHNCFGNNMHLAHRFDLGERDAWRVLAEHLTWLAEHHPAGYAVRLHIIGDFFSVDYVRLWAAALDDLPPLHVWGYTARDPEVDPIGRAIRTLASVYPDRFVIRWSRPAARDGRMEALPWLGDAIDVPPEAGFLCPAQRDSEVACANCCACWESERNVFFRPHGGRGEAPRGD